MDSNRQTGQITVFSALILLAVLLLAGVIVDISRICAGRSIVKKAVDVSARSLLADYGSRLKEDYGIFAMPSKGTGELKDLFEEYLTSNLSIPYDGEISEGRTDLFGFRIERISVEPLFNLSENEVTKHQILEYMKYRAPTELVEGFIEKLSAIKDTGKMSAAYKKKVGVDKILGSMDKSQQKLKKKIDGTGNASEKYVNGFNLGGSWDAAFNSFNSLSADLGSIISSLDSISSDITALEEQLRQEEAAEKDKDNSGTSSSSSGGEDGTSGTGNGTDSTDGDTSKESEKASDATKTKLDGLKAEQTALHQSYSDTMNRIRSVWNEMRYPLTGDFIGVNEDSLNEIGKIAEKGQKAQLAIADLETYLEQNFGSEAGEFSKGFKEQTQTELDKLKALILDGKKAEDMLEKVQSNSALLHDIAGKLDEAGGLIGTASAVNGLPSGLLELIRGYVNVSYDYSRPEKGEAKNDPRLGKAEAVKSFVEEILKDVNYAAIGVKKEDLPSHTKVISKNYDVEDAAFTDGQQKETDSLAEKAAGASYGGNLENIDTEVDLFDEEGMFQENALGFISDIGSMISGKATDLRDNVYVNEYIMGTFKNSVPDLIQKNRTSSDTNLHGIEKNGLPTFYDSEVEYILHGNASQKVNNIMIRGEVLLIRFGLDTLHVYTDTKKKSMATGIATAVAGWWTGGAGIPILSNLIMCGWGMGEAIIDVKDLMQGKSVPIYKMKGDWKLDIGLPAASEALPKTDERLYFNYHDYLRLFLLTMNEDKKLNRIEDLIQLNISKSKSGFKISECSTYVRVEAEVSMKYLFITQPFAQRALKTNDGRYLFKVLLYEGYQ